MVAMKKNSGSHPVRAKAPKKTAAKTAKKTRDRTEKKQEAKRPAVRYTYSWVIPHSTVLLDFLLSKIPLSRNSVKKLLHDRKVLVNGKPVTQFDYPLAKDDEVKIAKNPLILVTLGIVYIIETLSDIIQVVYFKLSHGKRVFRMAPIHHHLEMGGWTGKKWTEREIFVLFTGISLVFAIISFIGMVQRYL